MYFYRLYLLCTVCVHIYKISENKEENNIHINIYYCVTFSETVDPLIFFSETKRIDSKN